MNRAECKYKQIEEAKMEGPSDGRAWTIYNSGCESLTETFFSVFSSEKHSPFYSIQSFVDSYRNRFNRLPTGLEIAGQGKLFEEYGMKGIANTLAAPHFLRDQNSQFLFRDKTDQRVSFVVGDINKQRTQKDIARKIRTELYSPPSLVVYRPAGGIYYIEKSSKFYQHLIQWLLSVSDQRQVLLLMELPQSVERGIAPFLNHLSNKQGYEVSLHNTDLDRNELSGELRISKF